MVERARTRKQKQRGVVPKARASLPAASSSRGPPAALLLSVPQLPRGKQKWASLSRRPLWTSFPPPPRPRGLTFTRRPEPPRRPEGVGGAPDPAGGGSCPHPSRPPHRGLSPAPKSHDGSPSEHDTAEPRWAHRATAENRGEGAKGFQPA